jgi:uncharacterized protein YndB with AHSA1/START domain
MRFNLQPIVSLASITFLCAGAARFASAAQDQEAGRRMLVHEAVIEAPVERVWAAFTTSEGFRQWAAPKAEIDFRIGGEIRAAYHPESNLCDERTIVHRILSYDPHRMLSIRNVQAPAGFVGAELFQQTWSVIFFTPVDANRTLVRMEGVNYGEGEDWDTVYNFFQRGNAYSLQMLQAAMRAPAGDAEGPAYADPAPDLLPIEVEVTVNAVRGEVWQLWTTQEGVASFFAPNGKVERRLDGPFELYFLPDAPEGQRGSEGCRFLTYSPLRMVSLSWNAPPHLPFARQHHTWLVIWFDVADEEGKARVRLKHMGFAERVAEFPDHAEEFAKAREYFARAWPRVLESLRQRCEADDTPR